jgi:pimeloyl-ACP methyl ester carboxylesterase
VPSPPLDPLPRPVPRLERQIDGLSLSEWPGRRGPLVCLGDPLGSLPGLADVLASALSPDWRVIQPTLGPEVPYQSHAAQTLWLLDTFGFEQAVLLGGGLAAGVVLLVAAWYPTRVAGLVLVNGGRGLSTRQRTRLTALAAHEPALRAWLDTPPAWSRLERQVTCPVLRVRARAERRVLDHTRTFLGSRVESDVCC